MNTGIPLNDGSAVLNRNYRPDWFPAFSLRLWGAGRRFVVHPRLIGWRSAGQGY